MSREENFLFRYERKLLNEENKRRAEQGLEPKPIPFNLMTEAEQDIALERSLEQDRLKAKYGFSKDTPVRFIESNDEEDNDEESEEFTD